MIKEERIRFRYYKELLLKFDKNFPAGS